MKHIVSPVSAFYRKHIGPRLAVILSASVAALWAFGALHEAVLDDATVVSLDVGIEAMARERVSPAGVAFFGAVSRFGSPTFVGWTAVVGAVLLWRRRDWRLLAPWVAAFAGFRPLELALKATVQRSRPPRAPHYHDIEAFSFPSGHAIAIVVGVGMVLYTLFHFWKPAPWIRALTVLFGVCVVLLVGVSRVYLGAHYPSDVLGGYTAAIGWLSACLGSSTIAARHRERSGEQQMDSTEP